MKPTAEEINKITVLEDVGNVSEWLRAINKVAQGSEPEAGVWALNSTLPSCHPSRGDCLFRKREAIEPVSETGKPSDSSELAEMEKGHLDDGSVPAETACRSSAGSRTK